MIWQEPAKGGYPDRSFLALPGEGRMGAARRGLIPYSPMGYLTELTMTEGSRGHSTFSMPASPWFANSSGLISGGVLALIGDAALGSVIHSDVGPGQGMTTAELSMSFLRPVVPKAGTAIIGSGQLIHRGRSLGISEAFLFDHDDQLISHGTTRCTVFPPVDPLPDPPEDGTAEFAERPPGDDPNDPLRRPVEGEVISQEVFERRSGLEILRDLIAGELPRPPIYHLTGLRLAEAEEGETVAVLPCSRWLSTSAGTIQGGFTAMLAESAMTSAAFSTAPADAAVATLDFKVNYLRPVFPDGNEVTARARILHRGRTLVVAAAELTNAEGKKVALATGSSMYLPGRPANLVGVELGSGSSDPEDDPGA
ncbi:MAG TPA: PaaI family thioesterase [Solirubrobacterales bacterium]